LKTAISDSDIGTDSRPFRKIDRFDYESNTLDLTSTPIPKYIVGYGPPESTVAPASLLFGQGEFATEANNSSGPGWTEKSIDEAWSAFQPQSRRLAGSCSTTLASYLMDDERGDGSRSRSDSESGSIRTIRTMYHGSGDELESASGSGGSSSSTGTVIFAGQRAE
jgi:hypothetical protein